MASVSLHSPSSPTSMSHPVTIENGVWASTTLTFDIESSLMKRTISKNEVPMPPKLLSRSNQSIDGVFRVRHCRTELESCTRSCASSVPIPSGESISPTPSQPFWNFHRSRTLTGQRYCFVVSCGPLTRWQPLLLQEMPLQIALLAVQRQATLRSMWT